MGRTQDPGNHQDHCDPEKRFRWSFSQPQANDRDIQACYAIGANTYIQKPVDFDGLIADEAAQGILFEVALLPKDEPL